MTHENIAKCVWNCGYIELDKFERRIFILYPKIIIIITTWVFYSSSIIILNK